MHLTLLSSGRKARRHQTSVLAALSAAVILIASPAAADPVVGQSVARWEMNEARGSTVMLDTDKSRALLNGTIGSTVALNGAAHTFATDMPADGYRAGHVNVVPHHQDLNPGSGNYAFTIRYKTDYRFGNIMQKGQGTAVGGYWKLEGPLQPRCMFRGSNGETLTGYLKGYAKGVELSKGVWHTITCERIMSPPPGVQPYVRMWVNGVAQPKAIGSTGTISNTAQMSIGGKSKCGGSTSCDYFVGQIDYVEIRKG